MSRASQTIQLDARVAKPGDLLLEAHDIVIRFNLRGKALTAVRWASRMQIGATGNIPTSFPAAFASGRSSRQP